MLVSLNQPKHPSGLVRNSRCMTEMPPEAAVPWLPLYDGFAGLSRHSMSYDERPVRGRNRSSD